MTTVTLRMIKGDSVIVPDVELMEFKTRRGGRSGAWRTIWDRPIEEIGSGGKRADKQRPKTARSEL